MTLLPVLERYYDAAPRVAAETEEVGPLTLFVAREGWPYYARPRLGLDVDVTVADVAAVLERQRELDVPRALEWVHETTPALLAAARGAGMRVEECPLLVLADAPRVVNRGSLEQDSRVRLVGAADEALPLVQAAISLSFAHPGTAVGEVGVIERDAHAEADSEGAARVRLVLDRGTTVLVGAFDAEAGPVGGGSHNPRGDVTEVVGVGILPAYRRRGFAGAVTAALARDALDRGVSTVFCSAEDDDVARVYEAVGFRRVGTACIAEAP